MLDRYLEPLKEETFFTTDEMEHVFGNIHEIAQFQRQFLISLEEAIQMDSPFFHSTDLKNYRVGIHGPRLSGLNEIYVWLLLHTNKI